jgi:hypothetical protein
MYDRLKGPRRAVSLRGIWMIVAMALFLVGLPLILPTSEVSAQLPAGPSTGKESQGESIKGFRVPDYNEDGSLKSILYGSTAVKNNKTLIWNMTGVKIEMFSSNKVSAVVTSPGCDFEMRKGTATSEKPIVILHDRLQVQGTGYTWDQKKENFKINSQARVMIRRDGSDVPGILPAETKEKSP